MKKLLIGGLILHFLIASIPLVAEVRLIMRDLPLLWGKSNKERRIVMLGGVIDSIEDHGFIARCKEEIPLDADVLVVSNSLINVFILNYYLYPRRTNVESEALGNHYWTVHYFTPKALGLNSIEGPRQSGTSN